VKHVLRYFIGGILRYIGGDGVNIQGYSESDWVGSEVYRKRTTTRSFNLGSILITWFNRNKIFVSLNSAKAKFIAMIMDNCESNWLWELLIGLFYQEWERKVAYSDNHSCIRTL
jgi:hypothetical protein